MLKLFEPIVSVNEMHPNFRRVAERNDPSSRDVVQAWADGFVDRDGKFIKEFQTTFNSSFWELYLYACLKDLGLNVDFSKHAPDFVIAEGSEVVANIEAVTTSNADGFRPESQTGELTPSLLDSVDNESFIAHSAIRLSNSITAKNRKFLKSYSKLDHVRERPFVIAIAPFDQPFFYTQCDRAIRNVLYGYDMPLSTGLSDYPTPTFGGNEWVTARNKNSGAAVPMGLFRDLGLRHVSAILFSNTATWGKVRALSAGRDELTIFQASRTIEGRMPKPEVLRGTEYVETILDGLHVFLNPLADYPLDTSVFEGREVYVHSFDLRSGLPFSVQCPNGFLMMRQLFTVAPMEERTAIDSTLDPPKEYMLPRKSYIDEISGRLSANIYTFSELYAHQYRGWTILCGHDPTDGEWRAQARLGRFQTVGQFLTAVHGEELEEVASEELFTDRDSAVASVERIIDEMTSRSHPK